MFCHNCGKEISNDSKFCPNCGQQINNNYYSNTSYNNSVAPAKTEENSAVGILAIVFSIIGGWLGLIFSIIGLCMYKEPKNRKYCKIALGISIAITVLCIIWAIIVICSFNIAYY